MIYPIRFGKGQTIKMKMKKNGRGCWASPRPAEVIEHLKKVAPHRVGEYQKHLENDRNFLALLDQQKRPSRGKSGLSL